MALKTFKIVDGDFVLNEITGRFETVEGVDKLRQDVARVINTDLQVDGTGSGLDDVIGTTGDVFSLRALISRRVTNAFNSLKLIQDLVQKSDRSLEERFGLLRQIIVTPFGVDGSISSTSFALRVDVLSQKNRTPIINTSVIKRA